MKNKTIETWAKVAALVIGALLTIIACAGVWNYCPEAFVKVVAVALLLANGYAIYRKAIAMSKDNKIKEE